MTRTSVYVWHGRVDILIVKKEKKIPHIKASTKMLIHNGLASKCSQASTEGVASKQAS